jgi:plasmid stability protein
MPTITVKNIPAGLYERLKLSAKAHRRSINSEILVYIERAVGRQEVDPEATIVRARTLREKTEGYRVTDEEFTQAKAAGRA